MGEVNSRSLDMLDDSDCKKCIRNSRRLLDDAYLKEVSPQTKLLLTELALEEASKATIIWWWLHSRGLPTRYFEGDIEKKINEAFFLHPVKIDFVKRICVRILHFIDELDYSPQSDYMLRTASYALVGQKSEMKKNVMKRVEGLIQPGNDVLTKALLAEMLEYFLNTDINKNKLKATYVDFDKSHQHLEFVLVPHDRTQYSLGMMVYTLLLDLYRNTKDELKRKELTQVYANEFIFKKVKNRK